MTSNQQPAKGVVVLGATSAIARATAHAFAHNGYDIVLGALDDCENEILAADIRTRFDVSAYPLPFDAAAFDSHEKFLEDCTQALGDLPEGIVLCFGYMVEQEEAQQDFAKLHQTININLIGAMSILEKFSARFETRKRGFITVLSSVAGDRGRQSNYIYGASKAGLSAYLQGLRNRLHKANVSVTTIKPGFVDTKMTYGLPLPSPLVATPQAAGRTIYRATVKGKSEAYVPFFWRYIMLIIKYIPEWQFKKMGL